MPQKRPLHLSTRVLPPPSTLVTAAAAAASGGGEGESSEKGLSEEVAPLLRRPKLEGSAVVLLPASRVLLPGASRSFHFYDANLLAALEHALASTPPDRPAELVILGYDETSRRLSYGRGTLATVGSVEESKRENKFAEKSESKIVTVTGLRPVSVESVEQYEPFMLASLAEEAQQQQQQQQQQQAVEEEEESESVGSSVQGILEAMVAQCNEVVALRTELDLPLLKPSADGRPDDTTADPNTALEWCLATGLDASCDELVAWTCAQHLLPELRAGALELGGGAGGSGCGCGLMAYVIDALEETRATLLAMKSLEQLTGLGLGGSGGGGSGGGGESKEGDDDSAKGEESD